MPPSDSDCPLFGYWSLKCKIQILIVNSLPEVHRPCVHLLLVIKIVVATMVVVVVVIIAIAMVITIIAIILLVAYSMKVY